MAINFAGAISSTINKENIGRAKVIGFVEHNLIGAEYLPPQRQRHYDIKTQLSTSLMDKAEERKSYVVLHSRTVTNYMHFVANRKLDGVWAFTIKKDDFKVSIDNFGHLKLIDSSNLLIHQFCELLY